MAMDAITKDLFSQGSPSSQSIVSQIEDKLTTLKIISRSITMPLEVYLGEIENRENEMREFKVFT